MHASTQCSASERFVSSRLCERCSATLQRSIHPLNVEIRFALLALLTAQAQANITYTMVSFTRSAVLLLVAVLLLAPSVHVEAMVNPQLAKKARETGVTFGGPVSMQARQTIRTQRKERREKLRKEKPQVSSAATVQAAGNQ